MVSTNRTVIAEFKRKFGIGRPRGVKTRSFQRSYPAAATSRLTADWNPATSSGDSEIRYDITSLRDRSRELERSSDVMKRWLSCLEKNVLKSGVGFSLQNRAKLADGKTPDTAANNKIETAWREWSKKRNCTVNGEDSLYGVCRLGLRSTARDGGLLLQKIVDPEVNDFSFALRMVEVDHLDHNYNVVRSNQNKVVMGVEKNGYGKTVAFHLLERHPGDLLFGASPYSRHRVEAEDWIHFFVKERVTQCVGVPWAAPVMLRMHHLEQYELAELVASRAAANKGGYFTSERGDQYTGEKEETSTATGTEETGGTLSDSEPGQYDELPPGMSFVPYDPTHPTSQYGQFTRDAKLGISSGLDMSYATLVGDLTEVSFSSIRSGFIDERETFKKLQSIMIENVLCEIFESWLEVQLTTGKLGLPMSQFDRLNQPCFKGRRWDWVDPLKDVQAKVLERQHGLTTSAAIIAESDSEDDVEETYMQLAAENKLQSKYGLELGEVKPAPVGAPKKAPKDDEEEE